MLHVGRVVNCRNGNVEVCFERPEACKHCGACEGGKHFNVVSFPGEAPVGSMIAVEMSEKKVLRASVLAYVIPLCMLLGGIALGMALFDQEALWAVSGLVLMAASYLVLRIIDKNVKGRPGWQPEIVAVYEEGEMKNGTEAE